MIIHSFEDSLTALMVLALYMRMVADTGSQSAVVVSPALTTIVYITGLLIYFTTAKLMLEILTQPDSPFRMNIK